MFAPNHWLRKAVTALAIGKIGKPRDAATGGYATCSCCVSPARGPPTDWGELVQADDDWAIFQASPDELPVIDIHSL